MDNDRYLKNICCIKNCFIFQIWKKTIIFSELIIKQLLDSAFVWCEELWSSFESCLKKILSDHFSCIRLALIIGKRKLNCWEELKNETTFTLLQHVMAWIRIHFVTKQQGKYRGLGITRNKSFNWRLNSYMLPDSKHSPVYSAGLCTNITQNQLNIFP